MTEAWWRRERLIAVATPVAGPLLIVLAVAVVMHDFLFGGKLAPQNPDLLTVFVPNHCYLGDNLAAGHIPSWYPHTMGGAPFLADPQSGWMYAPAMLLYTAFPCATAARLFVVFQPLLAGLGLYWFGRSEGLSRVAATVGGLVLALALAGSRIAVSIPFSDSVAWTTVTLAAASRCWQVRTWAGRLGWATAVALAWGQIAAAHLSHGLVIGTGALLTYSIVRVRIELRAGRLTTSDVVRVSGVLVCALPAVNLAHLLPVIVYTSRSSLGLGYDGLRELGAALRNVPVPHLEVSRATQPHWPLKLATAPGTYLGAIALGMTGAALWSKRLRPFAIGFAAFGGLYYMASIRPIAERVAPVIKDWPFADFYPHSPGRFLYAVILAAAVLAMLGLDAWLKTEDRRTRLWMVVAGVVLFGLLPPLAGAFPSRLALLGVGALAGGAVLVLIARRSPGFAVLLPVVLAVELVGGALIGQAAGVRLARDGLESSSEEWLPLRPLPEPALGASGFVSGGPIADIADPDRGRLFTFDDGLIPTFRPVLAGFDEIQGYNPVEVLRYWKYVRAVDQERTRYNLSLFYNLPPESVLDIFQVAWVVAPPLEDPPEGWAGVGRIEDRFVYEVTGAPERASVFHTWRVERTESGALDAVTAPGFDATATVILEEVPDVDPTIPVRIGEGISYDAEGPDAATINVSTGSDSVVFVRNAYDDNWHATVDGEAADLLHADYVMQAVAVPAGRHTIRLTYVDPWVGYGLLGSALALISLGGGAVIARRRLVRAGQSPV